MILAVLALLYINLAIDSSLAQLFYLILVKT